MPKRRGSARRSLRPRLHIFCEGEKTEPNYLRGYIERNFLGTKLAPVRETSKNTPVQLVEEAIKEKNNNPPGDLFWVVFDREAENKYTDALHNEARNKAKAAGVKIAFSNVCFEVWILLHFQANVAAYSSFSSLWRLSNLKDHIKDYDKAKKRIFSEEEVFAARKNAKTLNKRTKDGADPAWRYPYQWNPYTDVYKLLDAIDAFGETFIDS